MLGLYFVSVLNSKRLKKKRNPKSERQLQASRGRYFPATVPPHRSPLPQGEGASSGNAFDNPSGLKFQQRGGWFSLSLRERARVRGNKPCESQKVRVLRSSPSLAALLSICAAVAPAPGQTSAPLAMVEVPIKLQ